MRSKVLIVALLGTVTMVALLALTVTAFVVLGSDVVQADEAVIEVAPLEVETVSQPAVVEPALNYERTSYEGGCPFSHSKMQLTQKEVPQQTVGEDLLTLAE